MPPSAAETNQQKWEIVAIFALGVVALLGMFAFALLVTEPNDLQRKAFQVGLAVSAGGIGALIPGAFRIHSKLFRAGGAMGLFVFVYWTNPPSLTVTSGIDTLLQRAENALASPGGYAVALQYFGEAAQMAPKDPRVHHGLGRVNYRQGNYEAALENFTRAFSLSKKLNPTYAYNLALTQNATNRFKEAVDTVEIGRSAAGDLQSSELARLLMYTRGGAYLLLWEQTRFDKTSSAYSEADHSFKAFLQSGGFPKHWAYFNLACLKARMARSVPSTEHQVVSTLRREACSNLASAIAELQQFRGETKDQHVGMLSSLLSKPQSYRPRPGDPPACPEVAEAWRVERGEIGSVLEQLRM